MSNIIWCVQCNKQLTDCEAVCSPCQEELNSDTVSEIETLQSRIKELEAQLEAYQWRPIEKWDHSQRTVIMVDLFVEIDNGQRLQVSSAEWFKLWDGEYDFLNRDGIPVEIECKKITHFRIVRPPIFTPEGDK